VQKAHNFGLPKAGDTPIVMVGPGTGVAPFRAFLHERMATAATGPAWLFFGHQREAHDYFYRDEWEMLRQRGALTNLSLAWSRDGANKTYVQQRIREAGAELWSWFERGAHFYVCGDAKKMAKDVEIAVRDVAAAHGGMSEEAATAFVAKLKNEGRYQADVY
jgi:sulfite reductase (NADPH) flavoprotein alpha-component